MRHHSFFSNGHVVVALAIVLSVMLLAPALLTPVQAEETNTLTVRAYSTDGDYLHMYAVIKSDGETVATGYTPLRYDGVDNEAYTVEVKNYEDWTFSHWGGGSGSSNPRTLVLWADTHATAYFDTGSESDAAPEEESTPEEPVEESTVESSTVVGGNGLLVSLYMYPGSSGSEHWQQVIDEKNDHPSVPIVAIFNPSNGPGSYESSTFDEWVDNLQDAGVQVIGYVSDDYGSKSLDTLKEQGDKYKDWYDADGLFIDEFTNKPGSEDHYSELTEYAKAQGMDMTVGNPGTDVPPSYIGTVDVINVSEGAGYIESDHPNIIGSSWVDGGYLGWHHDHDKSNFAVVRYDVSWLDSDFVSDVNEVAGLTYLTSGNDSDDRWFALPSYYGDMVENLAD
jgi:hypothetical protein